MLEHRLREHFAAHAVQTGAVAVMSAEPAFVACPLPAGCSAAQYACVAEVYRLARELAEAQVRADRRSFPPAFSLN